MFGGFFKNMVKTADEVLISGVKVSVSITTGSSVLSHVMIGQFFYSFLFAGS